MAREFIEMSEYAQSLALEAAQELLATQTDPDLLNPYLANEFQSLIAQGYEQALADVLNKHIDMSKVKRS